MTHHTRAQRNSSTKHVAEYELLLKFLHQLLRYKFRIALVAIVGSAIVFGLSLLLENRYSSQVTVAINISEDPGGIQPNNYRGVNTIGVLEYDFIIDGSQANERERLLARMDSFGYISAFIEQHNLLQWLYEESWDEDTQQWTDGFAPDMREAVKKFKSDALYVFTDKKTDLLNVRITSKSPEFSAKLANAFVKSFNDYLRMLDLDEIKNRRNYLEQRLSEVKNTEIQRSIFRLLETQLAVESLINARANYPLEVIQPATIPLFESFPARKQWTALALVALLFLGVGFVVCMNVGIALCRDLKEYALEHEPKKLNPPKPAHYVE